MPSGICPPTFCKLRVSKRGINMKFLRFINKDVNSENAPRRGIVTLRILYLIQILIFSFDIFAAGWEVFDHFKYRLAGCLFLMILFFHLTYRISSEAAMIIYTFFTFFWILLSIPCFGWSAGMQNYFIIILMLCFFATHGSRAFKFTLSGLVLVARIMSIFCYGMLKPVIPISDISNRMIQSGNITAVFGAIIVISSIYSLKGNEAETKLMAYNDKLVKEANTDQLTGLYNRRRAMDLLNDVKSSTYLGAVSIVMGDIDFFKKVNDNYGHDVGDIVLKNVAETMQRMCGRKAFISRWGGEEFLLVFVGINGDETFHMIEDIRTYVMDHPVNAVGKEIAVTMTFGIAEYDFGGDPEKTIKEADEKLYMGKTGGRNRVVY